MKIGIVFEGGGGKGAYQIGVWKALKELGIEPFVNSVAGTSVGALNAALFYKGRYYLAEEIWNSISNDDILLKKDIDDYNNGDCIFSQKKLAQLINDAIKGESQQHTCKKCYVTCKYRDKNEHVYFEWSKYYDIELKRKILLASCAIPVIFESVEIDGNWYIDGGANGDNIPIQPLKNEDLDYIIVIHLSDNTVNAMNCHSKCIEIFPSQHLGGLVDGTLDFNNSSIHYRMKLGYSDAMSSLLWLADECHMNEKDKKRERNIRKIKLNIKDIKFDYMEEETMVEFNFSCEEARKEYEDKLAALKKISEDEAIDNSYLWDATVQKYASKMTKVNNILMSEGINAQITSKMFKDIGMFLKRCKEAEFHIALVGAIKAGKSTLINALLGHEYASTKVTPETAALTKFKKGAENYVRVTFYTKNEWDALWKSANDAKATVFLEEYAKLGAENEKDNWLDKQDKKIVCSTNDDLVSEIQKWTSSKSVSHYFVKEVEVGLKDFELPEGVVLVDTPGLDDVVEYRSNITRDYIDRANAVLVCVKSDALTGQEMATIYSVFSNTRYNPEKVYIIATQVDTLNRPKENWLEQKEEWLKYLKGKGAYASIELAKKNLVPVSAYLFTLLNHYNELSEDDDRYWDLDSIIRKFRIRDINEKYQEMLDFTNITLLKNKMQNEIVQNYKKLLIEDITGSYEMCTETIKETMAKIKTSQEEIIRTSQGGIEEIKKKQSEYKEKYNEAENDKKELENLLKKLKMATSQRADELEKAIKSLA